METATQKIDPPNHILPGVPAPTDKALKPIDSVTALGRIERKLARLNAKQRILVLDFLRHEAPPGVWDALESCSRTFKRLSPSDRTRVLGYYDNEREEK